MGFFEPLPPREEAKTRRWGPPLWDRPSEGTLGALLPVGEVLRRDDETLVAVDHLRVYPNGFTIEFLVIRNPNHARRDQVGIASPRNWPRVGVQFADGRTAGQSAQAQGPDQDIPKDDDGIPTVPVLRFVGGGGGGTTYRFGVWVCPLPPPGPLSVFTEMANLPESSVTIESALILDAAKRAKVIWA